MKVKEIMRRRTIKVRLAAPVVEVARKMRDFGLEAVAVCDEGRFLGFVWDHDIICRVVACGSSPRRTCTESLLRRVEVSISPDSDIVQAAMIMAENGIHLLPVLDRGRLVGLLSIEDMAAASEVFAGTILAAKARARSLTQSA